MGNGMLYEVPRFQRDYSWERPQWEELWEDIQSIVEKEEKSHYMGYLVFQQGDDSYRFRVIDGQQRLTTLSLIVVSAMRLLKKKGESERLELLQKSFIESKDLVSLEIMGKITLNRNNRKYYKSLCVIDREPVQRKLKVSENLMRKCLDFFIEKFKGYDDSEEISKCIQVMADDLYFTIINVNDELNAYKVFETLNARGVQLSSPDLLKNYLFSVIDRNEDVHDGELDDLDERWETIGEQLGNHSFSRFILVEWNQRHKLSRDKELFRSIRNTIIKPEDVDQYLNILIKQSQVYAALKNPNDELWNASGEEKTIRKNLSILKTFDLRQPYGLLMAAYENFPEKDFSRVLSWIVNFSIRYNVICNLPAHMEKFYNGICLLTRRSGASLPEIKEELLKHYPQDEDFSLSFANKSISTRKSSKRVRYILACLNRQLDSASSIDDTDLSLEHILPQNPIAAWKKSFNGDWEEYTERLGNMCLLRETSNLGQESFAEKKRILLESPYKINHESLGRADKWTAEEIDKRQRALSKIACQVWRIA